ncbi:MAG TPA: glycoside hydrolase family 15 protein [Methylomirabilota bacterium]|jgi:GH15 family glucan-1,4-alpha-glucosidase|nr:glycoside hydrolase family 15 protein [Methylomirabilota bacterium]
MPLRIEDYAVIGNCETAALVGRDGSIDWLCVPRFDSPACFAALLGTPEHGRWRVAPAGPVRAVRRRYRPGTLVLETEFETETGVVVLHDCMPVRTHAPDLIRVVEGKRGTVPMRLELVIRLDYGSMTPWVRRCDDGLRAIGGANALRLRTAVDFHGQDFQTVAEFTVAASQRVPFTLTWYPSHEPEPPAPQPEPTIQETEEWWREWTGRCTYQGDWLEPVVRSLITLKALTYAPTGGLVAAVTTSLPEKLGGVRNWDYRYCWLRDATFALYALMAGGYVEEARAWRAWLVRAVAGRPSHAQILYGVTGDRLLPEWELPWLPGYEGSAPVRVGNAASTQFQLDVYGEVADSLHCARRIGLEPDENAWRVERAMVAYLESVWQQPDEGIWEVRGPRRAFTHSRVMAWVAVDRAVKAVERFGLEGPVDRWRRLRDVIHEDVCRQGYDADLGAFVQSYGSKLLDASLLMIPLVGFLPATDPRMLGTVRAIQQHLVADGFVARYQTLPHVDGLPPGEGAFLPCTFWLADNLVLQGRVSEARELFERLLSLRNDVGLLSEEYDPVSRRLLGNFPQAFSHMGLINTAWNLTRHGGPAEHRPDK